MPNPLPGDGDLVATQGQVLPLGVIYPATYNSVSPVAAPAAKLGTSEPASVYQKVGCLRDDMFTTAESNPGGVE
jgi:hypothetical protein